jgi:hypothetical protein
MKKLGAAVFLSFSFLITLGAQHIHDPNDRLYKDIDRWFIRGYISSPPPLIRPYPAQLLDALLSEVINFGNEEAQSKASAYRDQIAPGSRIIHGGIAGSIEGEDDDAALIGAPYVDAFFRFSDWISAGASMYVYGVTKPLDEELNVPGSYSPYPDLVADNASVGPFKLMQDWTSMLSLGKYDFYVQAGLNRTSVGPFYENGIVVGPQAGRAGHLSLNYRQPKWSFEMLMLSLTASDDFGDNFFPEKYLVFHSVNFNILPGLEFGFLESVVWGGRFEMLYLIPFMELFAAQSMADFGDNSLLGFHVRWNARRNTQILAQLYVDDISFNDLIRLKFNSKYKLAGELGVIWAPIEGPLESLSADYTAVFPYMYSHWNVPDEHRYNNVRDDKYNEDSYGTGPFPNYLVYSHMGKNLGTDLNPNTDRVSVRSLWGLLPGLDLTLSAYFLRHGNPSADADMRESERHDGSIFDDGVPEDDTNNYRYLHFLTQSVLDIRVAGGFGFEWSLPFPAFMGNFSLNMDYVMEYGWNRGLVRDNNGLAHYWSIGGTWRW